MAWRLRVCGAFLGRELRCADPLPPARPPAARSPTDVGPGAWQGGEVHREILTGSALLSRKSQQDSRRAYGSVRRSGAAKAEQRYMEARVTSATAPAAYQRSCAR